MQIDQGIRLGKKRISFILKKLQWYYGGKVEHQALKGLKELPESQVGRFQALVSDLIEASKSSEIVYSDEFKAPLHQSSKKFWRRTKRNTGKVHARFAASTTLTVAVAGTTHRLLAVKVYCGELTCDDYELFFLEVISNLKASRAAAITWVHDNAKWHLLHKTRGQLAGVKIVNTVPHFFQTNLLEFIFSSVRRLFRKRPLCATEQ